MRSPRYMTRAAIAFGLLGLGGCLSVLPEPAMPDALYQIDAPTERQPLAAHIIIREPNAPQIVAGRAMVSEDNSGATRLVPAVEWSGRSTRLLQLALVDSFAVGGSGAALLPDTGVDAPYALSSRLQAFELHGDEAVCDVSVVLHETGVARQYFKQSEVSVRRPVAGGSTADRALAMKAAAQQCVVEVSEFVSKTLAERAQP